MTLPFGADAPDDGASRPSGSGSTQTGSNGSESGAGQAAPGPHATARPTAPAHAAWFAARRAAAASSGEVLDSTTGLSPHVASILCYAATFVSAVIILMIERDSRLVRFHALQATFAFGFLCLLAILCGALTVLSAFYSTAAFKFFAVASEAAWGAMAVLWLIALVCVTRNQNWRMPLIGRLAQRRA
jgi:uncharacterized membrane protein